MSENTPFLILEERLIPDVSFHADIKSPSTQVSPSYQFRLSYDVDNTHCMAELTQTVSTKEDPGIFNLEVMMRGFFRCENIESQEDKQLAHIMAYNLLFPHMQAFLRSFTSDVGLPPLMIIPEPPAPSTIELT